MNVQDVVKTHNTAKKFDKWVDSNCKSVASFEATHKAFIKAVEYAKANLIFEKWRNFAINNKQKTPDVSEE